QVFAKAFCMSEEREADGLDARRTFFCRAMCGMQVRMPATEFGWGIDRACRQARPALLQRELECRGRTILPLWRHDEQGRARYSQFTGYDGFGARKVRDRFRYDGASLCGRRFLCAGTRSGLSF